MEKENKSAIIVKILKLFLEFLIAALVAWFGASCSRKFVKPIVDGNHVTTVFSALL